MIRSTLLVFCYLMTNIPFGRLDSNSYFLSNICDHEKILDFILYWKQDGRAFNTWDVKFLNHVKTCWNKEVEKIKKEPKINIDFYEAEEKPKSKKSNLNLKKYRKKYNI